MSRLEKTKKDLDNLKFKLKEIEDKIEKKHNEMMQIKKEEGLGEWKNCKERTDIISKLSQIIKEHIAGGNISAGLIGALVDHAHILGQRKIIEQIDKEIFNKNMGKI
tara:strand:+ start:174 stop:494 length:321 start_codon:yes stop_codon:yes gene_type:complete